MAKSVKKRNGSTSLFCADKVANAVLNAFAEVDGDVTPFAEQKAKEIANYVEEVVGGYKRRPGVEEIQDMIERKLQASSRKDVASAFTRYRYKKEMARNQYDDLMNAVEEKLNARNVQNQNANVDEHSFGGRMGEVTRLVLKKFALENCMSATARRNHENNMIYIHDLDSYAAGMHNCLTIPFDKLFAEGFNTRQGDIRPAGSVGTAFQLLAVVFQLQSLQQFGGVAASHIDWTMVPYVRKSFFKHYKNGIAYLADETVEEVSDLADGVKIEDIPITDDTLYNCDDAWQYAYEQTEDEINQAVEGMYHNLNTLQSRSGNQLPFTSINYGSCTILEGRMVTKALLEGSLKGVGKFHRTPIFPCGIFQVGEGINKNPEDPNYDLFQLALKSTAKRLYPNYANLDWSVNEGYDRNDPKTYMATMGL